MWIIWPALLLVVLVPAARFASVDGPDVHHQSSLKQPHGAPSGWRTAIDVAGDHAALPRPAAAGPLGVQDERRPAPIVVSSLFVPPRAR